MTSTSRSFPHNSRTSADRVNRVCDTHVGKASVNWLDGRVDVPSGVPIDLTDDERAMLGTGSKVGCVGGPISWPDAHHPA